MGSNTPSNDSQSHPSGQSLWVRCHTGERILLGDNTYPRDTFFRYETPNTSSGGQMLELSGLCTEVFYLKNPPGGCIVKSRENS